MCMMDFAQVFKIGRSFVSEVLTHSAHSYAYILFVHPSLYTFLG